MLESTIAKRIEDARLDEIEACSAVAEGYARIAEDAAKAYSVGPQKEPKTPAQVAREIAKLIQERKGLYP